MRLFSKFIQSHSTLVALIDELFDTRSPEGHNSYFGSGKETI
jgi:hypothetical protein